MMLMFNVLVVIGLICMLLISPVLMNIGLVKVSNDNYTISKSEAMLCCIPVFNHFYGWNKYSGSKVSLSGISTIILYLIYLIRLYVMVLQYSNEMLQTYSVYAFLGSIILFWILNAVDIFRVLNDSGVYTLGSKIFNSLAIITGQVIIGMYMPNNMKYYYEKVKKGTLYGRD